MNPLDGLNPEQRRAAEAVRGPVCILAGAGSGKTTTITRRIAQQVAVGAFAPNRIMAVTFTDKAAGELKQRLAELGVSGVRASTFHSAALRQLRHFAPDAVGRILPSKVLALRQIANSLPAPYKFRPAGDLATEIEWAKNRRIAPDRYDGREPPIPIDLMQRVYREYEKRKSDEGLVDFEDLLELTVRLFEENAEARETFRAQYRAFTVDEVQDVNLLQQQLLDLWLGERDDLCVVGDDYQSIYGFTGASPDYLLAMPQRFPNALVARLEENYRSTPQVLALANRLVPNLGGAEKTLRSVLPAGAEPVVRPFASPEDEGAAIVAELACASMSARGSGDPRAHERPTDRLRGAAARRRHPVPGLIAARARCSPPVDAAARAHLCVRRPKPFAQRRPRPGGSSACLTSSVSVRPFASRTSPGSCSSRRSSTVTPRRSSRISAGVSRPAATVRTASIC